jgi:hypothetical protein
VLIMSIRLAQLGGLLGYDSMMSLIPLRDAAADSLRAAGLVQRIAI